MMEETSNSFRFLTDGLSEAGCARAVRELYERTTLPGKIEPLEPLPDCAVRADIRKLALPGLSLMSGTLSGLRQVARPSSAVSSSEDDLLFAIYLCGHSVAHQGDRELRLDAGDALFATRGSDGFAIMRPTPVRFIAFRVPRRAIASLVGRLDDSPIRIVPRRTEALDLLLVYAGAIADGQGLTAPELRPVAVTHIQELIAATVSATRCTEGRSIRAARLRAIMADISANLADCSLTATAVARRQRMIPRYVHKLFEGEGLTFSTYVVERRLSYVHRVLSNPHLSDRTIGSVAFDAGFGDLSYFNRMFRRRYNATPTDIRLMTKVGDSSR